MPFDVALAQARPALGDLKGNAARVIDTLRRERAELVVYPELFLSGYAVKDGFAALAVDEESSVVRELAQACRDARKHLVVGAPTRSSVRGVLHNSLLFFTPDGYAGKYDKVYLPTFSLFEEDHWFQEGATLPVFDAQLGGERVRLGLSICYDLFFPEVTKALARQGADVLVCAAASPTPSRAHFESVFPARAVETTCHLLFTNLAGAQDAALFWGGAQAWSAKGGVIARGPYDEEAITRVTLDLADVAEARRRRPVLRDTRSEVLRMLLDAKPGRVAMKVAALVSGGKDSVLAAHVAENHGWDVTHLVTVRSRAADSYMFHTPNVDLAPLIADAMGKPLVTVETAGEKEAEVADLERALAGLPIDGFVSGALASEYQRTRLEGIGHRLDLRSFAPLWHKDPLAVLDTVAHEAWDVRFAAVAAEGLGEAWLGRRLDAAARSEIVALRDRYGVHPGGEGGEYETLVLDAPCYHQRIEVVRAEREWRRDGGAWRVREARLVAKPRP